MRSSHHLTPKERAVQRRALLHDVRRHPRVVLRPWFLRRATVLGVDLPVSIRLNPATGTGGTSAASDDVLSFALGTGPTGSPLPDGLAAGTVATSLTGALNASLRFSQDNSGYGLIGVVEMSFGPVAMTGTAIDLVDDAAPGTCPDAALAQTDGPISVAGAPGSTGVVDLLGGTFSMDLHLSVAFRTLIRSSCSDPFVGTAMMDGSGRPPLPLRLDGRFRVSPAVTADGRLRLGRLVLSGPQHDSYAELHTCTAAAPDPCTAPGDGVLPGRLSTTSFTAELIVGSAS